MPLSARISSSGMLEDSCHNTAQSGMPQYLPLIMDSCRDLPNLDVNAPGCTNFE